jgi:aminopeptidase N
MVAAVSASLSGAGLAEGASVHGSAGLGDPFFPRAGNGGYDVSHYALTLRYAPSANRLRATARISARATEGLSRFDLDLRGLHVLGVRVDGTTADFRRRGQELVITPGRPLAEGRAFQVRVRYRGRPHPVIDPDGSKDGWVPTNDGAFVAAEPQGAPTWFPCNDHPSDKAKFDFRVTVPKGISAVANGQLGRRIRHRRHSTFLWHEHSPMATYLATVTTGRFEISHSRADGIPSYVAVDPTETPATSLARIPAILRSTGRRIRSRLRTSCPTSGSATT